MRLEAYSLSRLPAGSSSPVESLEATSEHTVGARQFMPQRDTFTFASSRGEADERSSSDQRQSRSGAQRCMDAEPFPSGPAWSIWPTRNPAVGSTWTWDIWKASLAGRAGNPPRLSSCRALQRGLCPGPRSVSWWSIRRSHRRSRDCKLITGAGTRLATGNTSHGACGPAFVKRVSITGPNHREDHAGTASAVSGSRALCVELK